MDPRLRNMLVTLLVTVTFSVCVIRATEVDIKMTGLDSTTPLIDELPEAIPASVCKEIIDKANSIGWNNIADSIDAKEEGNHFSQDIYLKDRGVINNVVLLEMVKPYLDKLGEFVRTRKQRSRLNFGQALSTLWPMILFSL